MDTFTMLLIASAAFVVGAGLSYFLVRTGILGHARVVELEQALAASESELADYKQQVTTEFTDTAEKFRALNRSYEDLHRQLAKSANVLCGEAGAPTLLDLPSSDVLEQQPEDLLSASPVPAKADGPAPAKADGPAPAKADGPAPARADGPAPAKADGLAPAKAEEPAPAKAGEPAPAKV